MQRVAETRVSSYQEESHLQPDRVVRISVFSNLTMGPCHINDKKFSFIIVIKQNFIAFYILKY